MGNINLIDSCLWPGKKMYSYESQLLSRRSQIIYASLEDQMKKQRPILRVGSLQKNNPYNMIYFHGNDEDLSTSKYFMVQLSDSFNCNVYAIEYPSYGIYKNYSLSKVEQLKKDSLILYEFLTGKDKQIKPQNLIIVGRSIGTGPSCWLASKKKNFAMLILISPFSSIERILKDKIKIYYAYEGERFNNMDNLKKFSSPVTVIHGEKDEVINIQHSISIHNQMKLNNQICEFYKISNKNHNDLEFRNDIQKNIQKQLEEFNIFGFQSLEKKQKEYDQHRSDNKSEKQQLDEDNMNVNNISNQNLEKNNNNQGIQNHNLIKLPTQIFNKNEQEEIIYSKKRQIMKLLTIYRTIILLFRLKILQLRQTRENKWSNIKEVMIYKQNIILGFFNFFAIQRQFKENNKK